MFRFRILAILLLMLGSVAHSQVSFYVRPSLLTKTHQAHFDRYFDPYLKDKRSTYRNEYFTFINYGEHFYDRESIDLGLAFGINWNDKHSVELSYSRDNIAIAIGTEWNASVIRIDTLTNVRYANAPSSSYLTLGSDPSWVRRIAASYAYKVWQNKHQTVQFRVLMGLGVLHTVGVSETNPRIQTMYYTPPNPDSIDLEVYMYEVYDRSFANKKFSLLAHVGLGIDFVSKKKRNNLFSLEAFYSHSRSIVYVHSFNYRVVDKLLTTDYHYQVNSRGSGFYFLLSKKIQVYPWKSKKKDKNKAEMI